MSVTVIIPTTGAPELSQAIESVLNQTHKDVKCYVVCDGEKYRGKVKTITDNYAGNSNLKVCYLPVNVGANGFYGHRIYAAFTHLVDTDYVMYLDQDCWFDANHIESCVNVLENEKLEWVYSLRNIHEKDGYLLCTDDCESLGQWDTWIGPTKLIDTNCYCIRTDVATRIASVWHGGWGQDRHFHHTLAIHFPRYACTGEYTVSYRLGGNEGSVTSDFFYKGNAFMNDKYNGVFPWRKI